MIIATISKATGLSGPYLRAVAHTANRKYKKYFIPKKGKKGNTEQRELYHPAKALKFIQKWLATHILSNLPVHNAVYSYRKNTGISNLAEAHLQNDYLLRIDFESFFPSLQAKDVKHLISKSFKDYSTEDINFISSICCRNDSLPIGAPSSPILSNALLYELDTFWSQKARENGVLYTRYADDIYFSASKRDILAPLFEEFKEYINRLDTPSLSINHEKTIFTSRKRKRMITGLIITPERTISIGRERKRLIRALLHKFTNEELPEKDVQYLKGLLSFVQSVEPSYMESLKVKHSSILERLAAMPAKNTHRPSVRIP